MSFADSFWSQDYRLGTEVLFRELHEGAKENDDIIRLFSRRMELELAYGNQLLNIGSTKALSLRYADNDYVLTIKNAYVRAAECFAEQGNHHLRVADKIKRNVLEPFSAWCDEHRLRIGLLELTIDDSRRAYKTAKADLERVSKRYFNKCRLVEDFRTQYSEQELAEALDAAPAPELEEDEEFSLGGKVYSTPQATQLLSALLAQVDLKSHKVPILGTYHNVLSGSAITEWLLKNLADVQGSVASAELFGQDLIAAGFLRQIGAVGKTFINSLQCLYQWKPQALALALVETETQRGFANYLEDVKQAIGVNSVDLGDKTQYGRLMREIDELDEEYFQTTKRVDRVRCAFEETVMDHLAFMEKCELNRLRAIKKVTHDFLLAFAENSGTVEATVAELLVIEETINPTTDLQLLIDNYGTGRFDPHVLLYDNYYRSNIRQTFGVDLNVKSRLDRKAVPVLVHSVLLFLDSAYPDLPNDAERMALWTQPVHLTKVHDLRFKLNELEDAAAIQLVLEKSDLHVVTNVFKLFFMELPDSVAPHSYYDLIKTLYTSYPVGVDDKRRINGLQNTLSEFPVCNLATLDALLTHFSRLVSIIGKKDAALGALLQRLLSREFGNLVLRPKADNNGDSGSLAAAEKLQRDFMADLFQHKDTIFGELRKRSSVKKSEKKETPAKESGDKSRLEHKLKRAVTNAQGDASLKRDKEPKEPTTSRRGSDDKENKPASDNKPKSGEDVPRENTLRRSMSPKKKLRDSPTKTIVVD